MEREHVLKLLVEHKVTLMERLALPRPRLCPHHGLRITPSARLKRPPTATIMRPCVNRWPGCKISRAGAAVAKKGNRMYAIFVTIKIKPGYAEQFKEASLGDAQGSVRDEPGCVRFDMHQSMDDPNTFHLYEVYENQDAHLNAHRNAPHYLKWR